MKNIFSSIHPKQFLVLGSEGMSFEIFDNNERLFAANADVLVYSSSNFINLHSEIMISRRARDTILIFLRENI